MLYNGMLWSSQFIEAFLFNKYITVKSISLCNLKENQNQLININRNSVKVIVIENLMDIDVNYIEYWYQLT